MTVYAYEMTTWTDTTPREVKRSRATWTDIREARQALLAAVRRTDKTPGLFASCEIVEVSE